MGVIYKLREEVVHFIVSQRQSNPLASCRQLAENASQKFGLNLSKSSVHDVLKESGIVTPRGRKPKNKFEIPQEKKKQIQVSLSQVKSEPPLLEDKQAKVTLIADVAKPDQVAIAEIEETKLVQNTEITPEYEGAGKVFLKAARWDLGIYSENNISGTEWDYYLTYSKRIEIILENDKTFSIDALLPIERCIREVADGLINNIKVFILNKFSDEGLFKASMDAQDGHKIKKVSIVDENDHILLEFDGIMDIKRRYLIRNRLFVESHEFDMMERSKAIFFTQVIDNNGFIEKIMSLKGFDTVNKDEYIVKLLIDDGYDKKDRLEEAAEKLNNLYLYDELDRLVRVEIKSSQINEGVV